MAPTQNRYESILARVLARCQFPEDQLEGTGCWVWMGPCCRKGYGSITVRKPGLKNPTRLRTHTAVYDKVMGTDWRGQDDDMTLDHLCRETRCCNPDHLQPVPRSENSRRSIAAKKCLR